MLRALFALKGKFEQTATNDLQLTQHSNKSRKNVFFLDKYLSFIDNWKAIHWIALYLSQRMKFD